MVMFSPERDDRSLLTYAAELRSRVLQGTDAASMQNNCASKANLTMRLNRSGAVTSLHSLWPSWPTSTRRHADCSYIGMIDPL